MEHSDTQSIRKALAQAKAAMPSPREWWREVDRRAQEEADRKKALRKIRQRRRPKCTCSAYQFPHRPGSGNCRWPDPPVQPAPAKPKCRPYRQRYIGIRKQLAKNLGLHPIHDREQIKREVEAMYQLSKQVKRRSPRQVVLRNCEVELIQVAGSKVSGRVKSHVDRY